MDSIQVKVNRAKPAGMRLAVVVSALLSVVSAYAQDTEDADAARVAGVNGVSNMLSDVVAWQYLPGGRGEYGFPTGLHVRPPNTLVPGMPPANRGLAMNRQQAAQPGRERSTRRKIFGGIVGGAGGFFGGMFLGAAIEGDRCNCDDPGLVGALIGAPVGGVAGGILGYKFLF